MDKNKRLVSLRNSIEQICANKPGIRMTLGLLDNGKEEYYLFGEDGKELAYQSYLYEIGSITKTFTAHLLGKAVIEGKVSLEDRVDRFIEGLSAGRRYPTLEELATHTSGYPQDTTEFEERFKQNVQGNEYDTFTKERMIEVINECDLKDIKYPASYSNFGIGVLGECLAKVYGKSIDTLIEEYIKEIELPHTFILHSQILPDLLSGYENGKQLGNLRWAEDGMIGAAGYLCSSAEDMLAYATKQFDHDPVTKLCHSKHAQYQRAEGLPLDIGLCWILIPDLNMSFHNGETRCFSSILCMNRMEKKAVVLLSNYDIDELTNIGIQQLRDMK